MLLWLISSVCLLFGMHFHNLAHKPARSAVMRLAQRLHLVCPPAHHWVHHHNHTIHYCVVNGWANYVCDGLGVWRALECVIAPITWNRAARRRQRLAAELPGNWRVVSPAASAVSNA
jgi:ubiquitin-conjugating enzyme E2 variant